MNIQSEIIEIFENNRGENISGVFLADKFGITRSAIWKIIKSLRSQGYLIDAVTNKGYCMKKESNVLSAEGIKINLRGAAIKWNDKIKVYNIIDSTNDCAREYARLRTNKGEDGIFIANEQTKGKGRMGKSFYSPSKTGLYMSILLHKPLMVEDSLIITSAAAVATVNAIESVCGIKTQIKWVNDIYIENKKVCGILSEGSVNMETGQLEYIIIGIGINIFTEDFPDEIKNIAASVLSNDNPTKILRNNLAAEIINNLILFCEDGIKAEKFMPRYKSLSLVLGKNINVISAGKTEPAFVLDIDDKAQLIILDKDKQRKIINSGEVSIRLS